VLTLDTGSPVVSVALGRSVPGTPPEGITWRRIEQARSSELLIRCIDEILAEAGLSRGQLDGIVALRGPGSFTGLRVGLATAMGLEQALGVPTTTLTTLEVLASTVAADGRRGLAVVDALRGDWSMQPFLATDPVQPLAPAGIEPAADLPRHEPEWVVGHGIERLSDGWPAATKPHFGEPGPLAPAALRLLATRPVVWEPLSLTEPLYLRSAAAVPLPRRRRPKPAKH